MAPRTASSPLKGWNDHWTWTAPAYRLLLSSPRSAPTRTMPAGNLKCNRGT
jgi:hypothetical protein